MSDPWGWLVIAVSVALLLIVGFPTGRRRRGAPRDVVCAVAGAGVAVGGLLLFEDVGVASWIVGPLLVAALSVAHARALFAPGGPFRT